MDTKLIRNLLHQAPLVMQLAEIERQQVEELRKEVERLRKDKARLKRKLVIDEQKEDDDEEYESEEEQEFQAAEHHHKSVFESRGVLQADSNKPKKKLRRVDQRRSHQPPTASSRSPLPQPTNRYALRSRTPVSTAARVSTDVASGGDKVRYIILKDIRSRDLQWPPFKGDKVPKGKPKASDYETHTCRMIVRACRFYSVLVCIEDPFPDDDKQVMWADKAWLSICKEVQVYYQLTDHVEQIIVKRNSHARGALRDLIRPWIEKNARIANIATYTQLLDLNADEPHPVFHYQDTMAPSGFALHPIIQKAIQKNWFSDATGLGVRYSTYFSPIRNVTLALLFTTIEFCLDQWETGIFNSRLQFTEKLYKPKYDKHLRAIQEWREIDEEITLATMQELHDRARRASGAAPLVAPVVVGLSSSSRDRLQLELERQRRERQGGIPSERQQG
ncbi:hypothetical protein BD310DRAFT_977542 [Dichomitus squalens]|uniref:DUF6532 domain-containing protein n=1 Tax=Dichomitus squalens TaxID=114155 RepID=A0A4Q9PV04_9APHY|nr:hypothetical protein BD310DRAFT_977542 [Dichomitus squalens]